MNSAKFSAIAVAFLTLAGLPDAAPDSAFDLFAPDLLVTRTDRDRLDAGRAVVQVSAGRDGLLALSAVIRVNTTPERLLAWSAAVELLQKGRYVPEIGRLSSPPRLRDLDGLTVDRDDLEDLARCKAGDCGIKLSAAEIASLSAARGTGDLEGAFRQLLLERAAGYLERGDACLLPYDDHEVPVNPAQVFNRLFQGLPFLPRALECFADYVAGYPHVPGGGPVRESFLYWSKETLGMKPIVSITHFTAARFERRGLPDVVVLAKQVYATHYRNGSLTLTALVSDARGRYLVYINRSDVDAFRGFFGGVIRRIVERRVKSEAPEVLERLRLRLESGDLPAGSTVGTIVAR